MPGHAADEDLPLDDLVRGLAPDHALAGEFLTAGGTFEITRGSILQNAIDKTLHESTGASLGVFVEQGPAS